MANCTSCDKPINAGQNFLTEHRADEGALFWHLPCYRDLILALAYAEHKPDHQHAAALFAFRNTTDGGERVE